MLTTGQEINLYVVLRSVMLQVVNGLFLCSVFASSYAGTASL